MKKIWAQLLSAALIFNASTTLAIPIQPARIQMAILLDGSGSMQGLINQARRQLWKVVNELGHATKLGQTPQLEIAVYEYGKDNLPAESGYLRQLIALSGDLDGVSEKLNSIVAQGSEEYTGMAIQAATSDLNWSKDSGDYRAIFISGNETMEQGPVKVMDAVAGAVAKGITLNTIHAKGTPDQDMVRDLWQPAAVAGGGQALEISLNAVTKQIPTPFDDEIISLNKDLNATYIPLGTYGESEYQKMLSVDDASMVDGSIFDRGLSKSGSYYDAHVAQWDLVGAATESSGGVEAFLKYVNENDLPKDVQKLSYDERVGLVKEKANLRKEIQAAIKDLCAHREEIVEQELEKDATSALATLDKAMTQMLRDQLLAKGFELSK